MTTWTPATKQSEIWTSDAQAKRTFSPTVFSHATYNGLSVFSLGSTAGIYERPAIQAETWVAS